MDDAHRTTHDDGRQPIAIGHLSDSGDLKILLDPPYKNVHLRVQLVPSPL